MNIIENLGFYEEIIEILCHAWFRMIVVIIRNLLHLIILC